MLRNTPSYVFKELGCSVLPKPELTIDSVQWFVTSLPEIRTSGTAKSLLMLMEPSQTPMSLQSFVFSVKSEKTLCGGPFKTEKWTCSLRLRCIQNAIKIKLSMKLSKNMGSKHFAVFININYHLLCNEIHNLIMVIQYIYITSLYIHAPANTPLLVCLRFIEHVYFYSFLLKSLTFRREKTYKYLKKCWFMN